MEIYVAPDGNDSWSGLLPAPNKAKTDGPLASLHSVAARLECFVAGRSIHPAQFSVKEPPAGPVTVYLRGGVYALEKPLVLGPQHSFPVTFKAYRKEKPVISGARRITQCAKARSTGRRHGLPTCRKSPRASGLFANYTSTGDALRVHAFPAKDFME